MGDEKTGKSMCREMVRIISGMDRCATTVCKNFAFAFPTRFAYDIYI